MCDFCEGWCHLECDDRVATKIYAEMHKTPSDAFLYICKLCKTGNKSAIGKFSPNDTTLQEIKTMVANIEKRVNDQEVSLASLDTRLLGAQASSFAEVVKSTNQISNTLTESMSTASMGPGIEKRLSAMEQSMETHMKQISQTLIDSQTIERSYASVTGNTSTGPQSVTLAESMYSSAVEQHTRRGHNGTQTTPKSRLHRVDFDPSKCVVLHTFVHKSLAINHMAIRHSISNLLDNPVITFLNKFEHDINDPKLIIQFDKSSSVTALLEKWNPSTENCSIRLPQKSTPRSDGICFGVPKNITEAELLEHVQQSFPSCEKIIRFVSKDQKATGIVKLIFKENDELCNAIENGIYIQKLCLKLNIEKARPPKPRPLQCYQCWGYGHVASNCQSEAICRRCSTVITSEANHKDCAIQKKCCNCGSSDHDATNHNVCPKYQQILQKLISRESIRETRS